MDESFAELRKLQYRAHSSAEFADMLAELHQLLTGWGVPSEHADYIQ